MAIVETLEVKFRADMGNLGAQLDALAARLVNLSGVLEAGGGSLATGAMSMIQGVADALRNGAAASTAPAEAGACLTGAFSAAILAGGPGAASAAQQICASANFNHAAAMAAAVNAGAQLGQGFANGIASKYSTVMAAANRIANAAVARIRSALSIHSPSKVSYEMGGFFGEGFADGIRASVRMAQQSAQALSMGAADRLNVSAGAGSIAAAADAGGMSGMMRAAVDEALGGANLVVPLYVDGMKLGEASIRGINRVTRSAGRLMLEI